MRGSKRDPGQESAAEASYPNTPPFVRITSE